MNKSIIVLALLAYTICMNSQNDQELAIKIHNDARSELGIAPLIYSKKLAKEAKTYAKKLAILDKGLNHSKNNEDGENLYMSYEHNGYEVTYSNLPFKNASLSWYAEKHDYSYSKIGDELNFDVIGHYTQMIWKKTTMVGFGYARSDAGNTYVVARYSEAGNIEGQYPY